VFPRFVNEEDVVYLEKSCTSGEILEVLNDFAKEKIPGPDGWTANFFYISLSWLDMI